MGESPVADLMCCSIAIIFRGDSFNAYIGVFAAIHLVSGNLNMLALQKFMNVGVMGDAQQGSLVLRNLGAICQLGRNPVESGTDAR